MLQTVIKNVNYKENLHARACRIEKLNLDWLSAIFLGGGGGG